MAAKVAIPRGDVACPVEAVKAWRETAGITEGALFRRVWNKRAQRVGAQRLTARIVADVVKAGVTRLALDPATFGAHSLRSGLVTTAIKRGVNLLKICDQTGHKSLEMLRVYWRDAELFSAMRPPAAVGKDDYRHSSTGKRCLRRAVQPASIYIG